MFHSYLLSAAGIEATTFNLDLRSAAESDSVESIHSDALQFLNKQSSGQLASEAFDFGAGLRNQPAINNAIRVFMSTLRGSRVQESVLKWKRNVYSMSAAA